MAFTFLSMPIVSMEETDEYMAMQKAHQRPLLGETQNPYNANRKPRLPFIIKLKLETDQDNTMLSYNSCATYCHDNMYLSIMTKLLCKGGKHSLELDVDEHPIELRGCSVDNKQLALCAILLSAKSLIYQLDGLVNLEKNRLLDTLASQIAKIGWLNIDVPLVMRELDKLLQYDNNFVFYCRKFSDRESKAPDTYKIKDLEFYITQDEVSELGLPIESCSEYLTPSSQSTEDKESAAPRPREQKFACDNIVLLQQLSLLKVWPDKSRILHIFTQ